MTTKPDSLEDWEAYFADLSVDELLAHFTRLSCPYEITELAALYGRFVDIAFLDGDTSNATRALAACWVKALESVVASSFEEHSNADRAFVQYRERCFELACKHGYGTAMFVARKGDVMQVFDGDAPDENAKRRRAFLLSIAFGRTEDQDVGDQKGVLADSSVPASLQQNRG